jgi:hypothetical protein
LKSISPTCSSPRKALPPFSTSQKYP